jgi:tetrathionate reductase subunit A
MEEPFQGSGDYPYAHPENILYSVCLQCNTGCGIKVKIQDGGAVKIDGNPRAPKPFGPIYPMNPHPS